MKIHYFIGLLLVFYCMKIQAQCTAIYHAGVSQAPSCLQAQNGRIGIVSPSGTPSGTTFVWSNGANNRTLSGLGVGNYYVTITEPNGCVYLDTVQLLPDPDGIPVRIDHRVCEQTLAARISMAQPDAYMYQWNTGAQTAHITVTVPGRYSLTVTDTWGCTQVVEHTVPSIPAPIQATAVATGATGCDNSDGQLDLTVSGGMPPYTYTWYREPSGTRITGTEDLTNVPAGTYRVLIQTANGCAHEETFAIGGKAVFLDVISSSCGLNNGSITARSQQLTNPIFQWSNGATTPTINQLVPGNYSVTVTDGACTYVRQALVRNNGALSATIRPDTTPDCTVPTVRALVYGGTAPYTYQWNTGDSTEVIPYQANTSVYMVTVTDTGGCFFVDTLDLLNNPDALRTSAQIQHPTCDSSNGSIRLFYSSFPHARNTIWTPHINVSRFSSGGPIYSTDGLAAGRYIARHVNQDGCLEKADTFWLGETVDIQRRDASCGQNNGGIVLQPYNMTNPMYLWSNGATTPAINNLAAGQYAVTVTGDSCIWVDTIIINNAGVLTVAVQPSAACHPDALQGIVSGGAAPLAYQWSDGSTSAQVVQPVPGTIYTVTVTDANGCTATATHVVQSRPQPSITYSATPASCNNANGSLSLSVSSGTPPYQYQWSVGTNTSPTYVGLHAGQYAVTVTDNYGCTAVATNLQIGGQYLGYATAQVVDATHGNNDGSIDLTTWNIPQPTFLWSNGATTEDLVHLPAGRYGVTITDGAGCAIQQTYTVDQQRLSSRMHVISGYVYDVSLSNACQIGQPVVHQAVRLQGSGAIAFTDHQGYYEFVINGNVTHTVELVPLSSSLILCPTSGTHTVQGVGGNYYDNRNFYMVAQVSNDLAIQQYQPSQVRNRGVYAPRIEFCNRGNTIRNGLIRYQYDARVVPRLHLLVQRGVSLVQIDTTNQVIEWSFSGLQPGECRTINIPFYVRATIGDVLSYTATILPLQGDQRPNNNQHIDTTVVVASFDPNDKQVGVYRNGNPWTGGSIYPTDETLDYTIRFQNTGTAPAQWVSIRDTLDQHLLPQTIRAVQSSHAMRMTIEDGNVLVFTFDPIYLPDTSTDYAGSMGFVQFTIDRAPNLPVGTRIPNRAAIYFDYNPPIITNQPVSIIDQFTSVVDLEQQDWTVAVQPNPFVDNLLLRYQLEAASTVRIAVYDLLGQCVYQEAPLEQPAGEQQAWIRLSNLPSGAYLVRIEAGERQLTQKVIKR